MRSWKDRVSVSIPLLIKTAEEQAAAYEKIMGAFFENNQHMDPEERELIKRQQEAYRRWLEMRPPAEPPVEKRR